MPNCQTCMDCQRMIDVSEINMPDELQKSVYWRCGTGLPPSDGRMNRDICAGQCPKIAPKWCPKRIGRVTLDV